MAVLLKTSSGMRLAWAFGSSKTPTRGIHFIDPEAPKEGKKTWLCEKTFGMWCVERATGQQLLAVSGSNFWGLSLVDPLTQKEVKAFKHFTGVQVDASGDLKCVDHRDGRRVMTVLACDGLVLVDLETLEEVKRFNEGDRETMKAWWSTMDPQRLLLVGEGAGLKFVDRETQEEVKNGFLELDMRWEGSDVKYPITPNQCVELAGGQRLMPLILGSRGPGTPCGLSLINAESFEEVKRFQGWHCVSTFCFHLAGGQRVLAVGTSNQGLILVDLETLEEVKRFPELGEQANMLWRWELSGGRCLLAMESVRKGSGRGLTVLDLNTQKEVFAYFTGYGGHQVLCGQRILAMKVMNLEDEGYGLILIDTETWQQVKRFKFEVSPSFNQCVGFYIYMRYVDLVGALPHQQARQRVLAVSVGDELVLIDVDTQQVFLDSAMESASMGQKVLHQLRCCIS